MTRFTLPSDAMTGIELLGRLTPAAATQLASELESQLTTSFLFAREVNRVLEVTNAVSLERAERGQLADAIVGLQYLKLGIASASPDAFINDIVAAVKESPENTLTSAELDSLASNAATLVEPRPLRASVKAYQLRADHANVFLESQIYTDIRPVFDDDLNRPLLASLLTHTIKFSFQANGRLESLFLVTDSEDLRILQKDITRAQEKASALTSLIGGHGDRFGPALDQEGSE